MKYVLETEDRGVALAIASLILTGQGFLVGGEEYAAPWADQIVRVGNPHKVIEAKNAFLQQLIPAVPIGKAGAGQAGRAIVAEIDKEGLTFAQIADILERDLLGGEVAPTTTEEVYG